MPAAQVRGSYGGTHSPSFIVIILATTLFLSRTDRPPEVIEVLRRKLFLRQIQAGGQIKMDICNQVSSLQKTHQALDTSCYSSGTSPKLVNEERQNVATISHGVQVIVEVPSPVSVLASLMHTNPQRLSSSDSSCEQHSQFHQKENISIFSGKQTTIDIPNPAHSTCKTPQVLDTSNSFVGVPQVLANKVVTNGDVEDQRDQTNGDTPMSDSSLIHQALIEGQESSSFHILLPEAPQTTSGIAQQPSQVTTIAERSTQDPDLKTAVKVSLMVIPISVGGIGSVVGGLIEDKKTDLTHTVLFKAYASLSYISFFIGVILFLLTIMPLRFPGFVMTLELTMWVTLGTIMYAIDCATCIILLKSLVEVILLLVIPLPIVFVLIILRLSSRKN